MPQEPYNIANFFDWSGGIWGRHKNPLAFPQNALASGENVDLSDGGLKSRGGTSVTSSGSLPSGTIRALKQIRFPTPETSYIVAQVAYETQWMSIVGGPSARAGHSAVWDAERGRILLFGGLSDEGWFDDLWSYSKTAGWAQLSPEGTPPAPRAYQTAWYDPTDDCMYVWGGSAGGPSKTDLYKYDCEANEWSALTCDGITPSGRRGCFRTVDRSLIVYEGNLLDSYSKLDLASLVWTTVSTTRPDPFPRAPAKSQYGYRITYDPTNDKVVVYGGWVYQGELMNVRPVILDPNTNTWFAGTNSPVQDAEGNPGLVDYGAVACSGKIIMNGGRVSWFTFGPAGPLIVYDVAADAWTTITPVGSVPPRVAHALVVTDEGELFTLLGWDETDYLSDSYELGQNLCNGVTSGGNGLYASPDHLPTDNAQFTQIYDLGEGAGTVSFGVLNDRVVITEGINKPPLVWGGCMADDASDWMTPKAVIVSPDGENYYNAREVCDKDPDTVTDVQNIQVAGHIDICLDMPEVEALFVEMGTPNSGVPVEAQVYTNGVKFDDADNIARHDLKGAVVRWFQSSGTAGYFQGAEINIDEAAAVDHGSSKVGIPATGHGMVAGQRVAIGGTVHYNGVFVLDALTTANEFVISHTYYAESFTQGTEKARHCLTLGPGNDCPDVVAGMSVVFSDGEKTILTIAGDGSQASNVTLEQAHETADVTAIYGLVVDPDDMVLQVNSAAAGSMATTFNKTLDDAPFVSALGVSIRQVIKGSDITSSGDYIQVTIQSSDSPSIGTFYNDRIYLLGASIVERSGLTGNGVTTPTQLTWGGGAPNPLNPLGNSGGSSSIQLQPGTSITSKLTKFTIDETKDYLISMDFVSYRTYMGSHPYPYEEAYGKSSSVFLKQKQEGGGYWFKAGGGQYGYTAWGQATCRNSQNLPDGFTDRSMYPVTVAVSKIEVHTDRSATTALQVACTGDAIHAPLYFADDFVGVTVTESKGNTGIIWHAFSLDGRQTWKVFKDGIFRTIVKLDTVWKYLDASDLWQNAPVNDMLTAIRAAMSYASNQMTGDEFTTMTKEDWALDGGVVPKITQYMDFAVGMQVVGADIPTVAGYSVTFNDVGSVLIEGFVDGAWTPGDGWNDATLVDGITLAQSGIISYNGGKIVLDYNVVDGVPGFWLRIKTNGTAPETTITRILYKAPCQPLANIGDGQPDTPNGFIYVDTSENSTQDYTEMVSDNTETEFSAAPIPMATDDYLYVGFYYPFNAVEITPYANNNKITSKISAEYWGGDSWKSLDTVDGTAGADGKTLSGLGRITWDLPGDWKENIPFAAFLSRAFWVRFKVSAALTPTAAISECLVYSVPPTLRKHKVVEVAGNRIFLGNRPDAPDQVDVSRELEEYGFVGEDSGSYRVGGMDSIQAVAQAWNSLFVWKTESCHQLTGTNTADFQFQMVEAARHVPINSRVIVKAPIGSGDGDRYGLFFINRFGAFVNTGLHTDALWNTSRGKSIGDVLNWWNQASTPRLDLDYLHLACGEYWPVKNWIIWAVPMIVSGSSQTTNNRLIVYDLNLQAWLPPFTISLASLTTAYHYSPHAPNLQGEIGLYGGDYSGRILRLFHPDEATDMGVPVDCWVETGWLHLGSPEFRKILRLISLHGKTSNSPVTVTVLTDGDESSSRSLVFEDLSNLNTKLFGLEQESNNVQGRFFKFRISFSGSGDIYGLQIGISTIREWGTL